MARLTVLEVAQRCGCSPETVRRWVRQGKLPATKIGLVWFIDSERLEQFLDAQHADAVEVTARATDLEAVVHRIAQELWHENSWNMSMQDVQEMAYHVCPHLRALIPDKFLLGDVASIRRVIQNYFFDGPTVEYLLVSLVSEGDNPLYGQLIQHQSRRAIRSLSCDESRAFSLANEAVTKAFEELSYFHFRGRLDNWIFQILRNLYNRELRRDVVDRQHLIWLSEVSPDDEGSGIESIADDSADPERIAMQNELFHLAREAIDRAAARMRDGRVSRDMKARITRLSLLEGRELDSVAKLTGVNINTVATIVRRMRQTLRSDEQLVDWFGL